MENNYLSLKLSMSNTTVKKNAYAKAILGNNKSAYNVSNISYLNSSPQLLSFIPSPQFLDQF
jgi:hypothetical protein